ncbi:MAG: Co2+/Mg2+ efflux protein ApaG [Rhodospirillum sp.]|nr:Co2+/Mg2+ efflux protein ApaG [Rhodospirillum sp.]MCF8490929.1 Co2+/Mg2+ efflux protein ApaG [Rhodospirillum sp.]MCF8499068.1 Co2+/Mg2+ efflux protein ApaG [Rhodospirillum sp.]
MYEETTRDVIIRVEPRFLPDQSTPDEGQYAWSYHVTILNSGPRTVQLLRRHWIITDSLGRTQEVEGVGVVGETPTLSQGDRFEYTSGTPLATASGFMGGTYLFRDLASGEDFRAAIPSFSLDSPHATGAVH